MWKRGGKESRVKKFLKTPVRFLVKAKEFYFNGMTRLSGQVARSTIHKSFSVGHSSDYGDLVEGNLEVQDMKKKKKMRKEKVASKVHSNADEVQVPTSTEEFDVNLIPDDYGLQMSGSLSSSANDDSDGGSKKLTRAQRKRLRKKKIKEDACRRKGMIGPLLPAAEEAEAECTPGVRRNAEESHKGSNPVGLTNPNRVNQRRKAKKLANEKSKRAAGEGTSLKAVDERNRVENPDLKVSIDGEN
ncbi:hypothetical protein LINPERHAP2_LOCUS40995 [Linum perenne]